MNPDPQSSQPRQRSLVRRLRYWLIPANSKQESELWMMVKSARAGRYGRALIGAARTILAVILVPLIRWLRPRGVFAGEPYLPDHSRVVLYTNRDDLLPEYQPRRRYTLSGVYRRPVTLITTLVNEKDSLLPWLESLSHQTRLPDEVIIVDGGSTDGSLSLLQEFARTSPYSMVILSRPGVNIAQGRNLAVASARHDLIACTDLGCRLDDAWLENITAPFEEDPQTEVVAGWYQIIKSSRAKMELLGANLEALNPQAFLPSSRSIAFTKQAWEKVGGYPEWQTLTGEDSFFDIELKKACRHWAFAPHALVHWRAPNSLRDYWRKVRNWAVGDGESLFGARLYWHSLLRLLFLFTSSLLLTAACTFGATLGVIPPLPAAGVCLGWVYFASVLIFSFRHFSPLDLVSEIGAEIARVRGFVAGANQREAALSRRYRDVKGFFFMLAGVPIDDTGGGARCTQISLELLRRGFAVFYINKFPKYESVEVDTLIYHPNLFTAQLSHFRWDAFQRNYRRLLNGSLVAGMLEFPLKDFLPIVKGLRAQGGVIIYDLLDDWNTALGGDWYSPETEKAVIAASQVLIATEASLLERLEKLSGRPVTLLPNAVNSHLFDPNRVYPRPSDLPLAEWMIIYIGALWGSWFDWELLTAIACAYPEAGVVVIGDYRNQCPDPPGNLHFLGLKAQKTLPAYLAHSDVAIIPWLVNSITQATSPLKVYEYLTMRKPVVAPDLRPLQGLPGVFLARDRGDFIAKVALARNYRLPTQEIDAFVAQNNWQARLDTLLDLIQSAQNPPQP